MENTKTPSNQPDASELEAAYDRWYREDAPGKSVLLAALARCCDAGTPLRLLDIGCGTASFLARIRDRVSSRWELHGIDLSGHAIAQGRRRNGGLHLVQGDATRPAFPPATFDVVTGYGSWERFPDAAEAIAGAGRILVPGGRVFAMIPALGIHRTDRDDEGWYEDTDVPGSDTRQLQWNLRRPTWSRMFEQASLHLFEGSLARSCGARKPGVFFFGLKVGSGEVAPVPVSEVPASETAAEAFLELSRLAASMATCLVPVLEDAASRMAACLRRGGKILICGNGGSAADAQHFAAELVGRLRQQRRSLPAISLSSDPSVVTALANDYGYERVFARQIEGLGRSGDVLLVISTSGRSPNVVEAVRTGRQRELATIALLGSTRVPELVDCDLAIHVPHTDGQRIQEAHTAILHAICTELEKKLHGEEQEHHGK